MPLKKSLGKRAANKERTVRAQARSAGIKKFGPAAVKGKDVHHKNGHNTDNSPGNLQLRSHTAHGKSHGRSHGKRGMRNIKK